MEKTKPLESFMALAKFDQSLNELRYTITKLNTEHTSLSKELANLENLIELSKQELNTIQKSVHSHELVMKELDTNLDKQKKLLDTVTNQREYNAVKNAISQIKQEQHNYETLLIDEWNKLEHAKIAFANKVKNIESDISNIKLLIPEKLDAINKHELALNSQMQDRLKFLPNLPAEWLEKYEAMYTRVNNPIVQVEANACGACYQDITSQVMSELKHHKLIQCKGCFRFLFF